MLDPNTPLRELAGIGPKRAAALAGAGYGTVEDLLTRLPIRYEDRRRFLPLADFKEGDCACFSATVQSARLIRTRRRGFTIFEAVLGDDTAAFPAIWFNQPYLSRALAEGTRAYFHGTLTRTRTGKRSLTFENLQFESIDPEDHDPVHSGRIVPVYERIRSLSGRRIRSLIRTILDSPSAGIWDDPLPPSLVLRLNLPPRQEALREVHFPTIPGSPDPATSPFLQRLILEELFRLELMLARRRDALRAEKRRFVYETSPQTRSVLKAALPFRLTEGQRRAFREIVADLTSPHPMHRLLQGDVGSGKTILAVLSMAFAARNGLQSALMVPTEILAEQHERILRERLEPIGYRVVLLTSAVKGRERRARLAALASGEAMVCVGTHALLEEEVRFHRLGLIVVDEQQRFGVLQRARLGRKGSASLDGKRSGAPTDGRPPAEGVKGGRRRQVVDEECRASDVAPIDTLVMTATPIPRTLAMTLYGDMDVSILDDMPPGRSPVATVVRGDTDRPAVYRLIHDEIARGRQAFIVYPLREERSSSDLLAAKAMAARLGASVFRDVTVGLVHGGMTSTEKEAVMASVRRGEVDVLVSTTVIEVGIDVPNATVMLVEHAERYGLSQLHQLRGRIGRGSEKGTCILMAGESLSDTARARLTALERESSGFRLAEIDLELRGPGELLGTRQSGLPELRIADLVRDRALLEEARREAFVLVRSSNCCWDAPDRQSVGSICSGES